MQFPARPTPLWRSIVVLGLLAPAALTHHAAAQAQAQPLEENVLVAPATSMERALRDALATQGMVLQTSDERMEQLRALGVTGKAMGPQTLNEQLGTKNTADEREKEGAALGFLVRFRAEDVKRLSHENLPPPTDLITRVLAAAGVELRYEGPAALGFFLFRLPNPISLEDGEGIRAKIAGMPEVEAVDLDLQAQTAFVPNDTYFAQYQHGLLSPTSGYPGGIDAVGAWDITRGSRSTVVAIIDTGITAHPEFSGRVLPGYDMFSSATWSRDGDGRDADPSDTGDWVTSQESSSGCASRPSSWHGTHVAGIVAANGNNAAGIAGIDWNARILPVRALGSCNNSVRDIADAIMWAAGAKVGNLPLNPYPAKIINASLGGRDTRGCASSIYYQEAIQQAKAAGALVVVAAGNDRSEAAYYVPASCDGVLTVGAVDPYGVLASYSNYSTQNKVFISAPGGDQGRYGTSGGIASTLNTGSTTPAQAAYAQLQGTSMAAPMVSGVAALALAANPELNSVEVSAILALSVSPFPQGSVCETYFPACGAGIVNASNTVAVARALTVFTPVTEFFNVDNGHFFRTGNRAEPAIVESGRLGRWRNTEDYFIAWKGPTHGAQPVCRFYSYKFDSHFYTVNPYECEVIKRNSDWVYESIAFYAIVPTNGACPAPSKPVHRFYNNRHAVGDGNHRFTVYGAYHWPALQSAGWIYEGVAMCAAG